MTKDDLHRELQKSDISIAMDVKRASDMVYHMISGAASDICFEHGIDQNQATTGVFERAILYYALHNMDGADIKDRVQGFQQWILDHVNEDAFDI